MGRRNRRKRCTCHSSLDLHPCNGCGELGHLRNLCPKLKAVKKTGGKPCQLCNGQKHLTHLHYCGYCSYYPKVEVCYPGDPQYQTGFINWIWLRLDWAPKDEIEGIMGHNHSNCLKLKRDSAKLKIPLNLEEIEGFLEQLSWIIKHLETSKGNRIYYHKNVDCLREAIPLLHYWKTSPCLSEFWQQLSYGLLIISPYKESQLFDCLLELVSMFLVHLDQKQAEPYYENRQNENSFCQCHQPALNRCIVQLICIFS